MPSQTNKPTASRHDDLATGGRGSFAPARPNEPNQTYYKFNSETGRVFALGQLPTAPSSRQIQSKSLGRVQKLTMISLQTTISERVAHVCSRLIGIYPLRPPLWYSLQLARSLPRMIYSNKEPSCRDDTLPLPVRAAIERVRPTDEQPTRAARTFRNIEIRVACWLTHLAFLIRSGRCETRIECRRGALGEETKTWPLPEA